MLNKKGISKEETQKKITLKVQEAIDYSANLEALNIETYKRDIKNNMYKIENTNNFIVGEDGAIYIIYAYGNNNYTSEHDIIYIK